MHRYVIDPEVAMEVAARRFKPAAGVKLLAPTLLRSQVLAQLYVQERRGEIDRDEAARRLDHLRALNIRLLGDRVLQHWAWKYAAQLGWADTFTAEYLALTKLQGDALVAGSDWLAEAAAPVVPVVRFIDWLKP
jgi:predicted nucleic acid-binding protein